MVLLHCCAIFGTSYPHAALLSPATVNHAATSQVGPFHPAATMAAGGGRACVSCFRQEHGRRPRSTQQPHWVGGRRASAGAAGACSTCQKRRGQIWLPAAPGRCNVPRSSTFRVYWAFRYFVASFPLVCRVWTRLAWLHSAQSRAGPPPNRGYTPRHEHGEEQPFTTVCIQHAVGQ